MIIVVLVQVTSYLKGAIGRGVNLQTGVTLDDPLSIIMVSVVVVELIDAVSILLMLLLWLVEW